ncbi:MAG: FAD-dependent oxidoreductase [Albidovulum sp.]|nr:FAD-dependent oxidoreductase [Albidovulum sp.]MDE0307258.1 FAD-dependent oxidoreductase [Albidovulum sp.]MDE0532269.1 FAD-dependent oxidoreductase [Albidovulum sp.]
MDRVDVAIVGAGQAGISVAAKLRRQGFEGRVMLLGEEEAAPYQRPPLSKKYLTREFDLERLFLRPRIFFEENRIELCTGQKCIEVDPERKILELRNSRVEYQNLVLAVGSAPRRLPENIGGSKEGVFVLRDIADADSIAKEFSPGRNLLVVGGGYIGLEVASSAKSKGLKVTVIEMAERILQRVAAPETSLRMRDLHVAKGVEIKEGIGVEFLGGEKRVSEVALTDGSSHPVDIVVAGIGILPRDELAGAGGLKIDNGIWTNSRGQTSVESIWAAGDCASFPWKGKRIRLESVQNAIDQAEMVAVNIAGDEICYDPTPWFWSDQYDAKLQIAGLCTGYDNVVARKGASEDSFSHWYFKGDQLLAVDAVNDSRAYMVGKRLLESGETADKNAISDSKSNLKLLLKR